MTLEQLIIALARLDTLYGQRESFQTWLAGDTSPQEEYEQLKQEIETEFPGLQVVYVDITYKHTHALIASD